MDWGHWLTWPKAILGGVVAFSALGLLAVVLAWRNDPGRDLDRDLVAVMPFHAVGGGTEVWSEGLVDLLSAALDGTGVLHAADPRAVMARWDREVGQGHEEGTREEAAEVAVDLGSGRMIVGSVIRPTEGQVNLVADLFDVRWMAKETSASVAGPESNMVALVDRLAVELLKEMLSGADVPEVRVSAITTESVAALRAYLEGVQAFRRSQFDDARTAFQRAVDLDSTFAVAAHGLSRARGWSDMELAYREATLLAARHTAGLPARDSLLIVGRKLVDIDGDPRGIELYEGLTRRHPEDFEAWYGLAEAIFHHGHEVGRHLDGVIEALSRAYAIDSTVAPAYFHGVQSAFILDDTVRARRWSRNYLALDSTSEFAVALRLALDLRLGSDREKAAASARLDTLGSDVLERIVWFAPAGWSSLSYMERVLRAAAAAKDSDEETAGVLRILGREYLRHGQVENWLSMETEASSLDGAPPDLFSLTVARIAGLAVDSTVLALHDRLAEEARYPSEAPYLSIYWAREGRFERAGLAPLELERLADSLAIMGDPVGARDRRGSALALRGQIALAQGDSAAALEYMRRGVAMMRPDWVGFRGFYRYLLADLLRRADPEEADRIYGALRRPSILEAPGYLHAARICEDRGERQRAEKLYRWFLDLWSGADAHLQPEVESAREALERLVVPSDSIAGSS